MRKIYKIARLELTTLFYSPIGWLVLSVFMIQCGLTLLDTLQQVRLNVSLGQNNDPITWQLFSSNYTGLYSLMKASLYLYIPILTMGLMSREISSGSIKLLLSSPVKLSEIIVGKYLAVITYGLMLIGILGIYALIGSVVIKNVDSGTLLSGLMSLYLLICTYAAIGLFMSSLTIYQVVAAISTLMVFALMQYIGGIWQNIDFVRDLTYFLSISGRTEKMTGGLITTKDVFYYLIIITSFLILCILRLKTQRNSNPWGIKAMRYLALFCSALLVGYLTSRPMFTGYWDVTALKSFTLTNSDQDLAKKIKGPLKVTTYANLLDPFVFSVVPEKRNNDLDRLEMYKRFIPGLDVSYVYYYNKPNDTSFTNYEYTPALKGITNVNELAKKTATVMGLDEQLFLPPGKITNLAELEPEGYYLVRKLEYNGKTAFVRFFRGEPDPYAHEAEFMAAVKGLINPYPKVVFITGNNERGITSKKDRDYKIITLTKYMRVSLINHGFDFDEVDLNKSDIPTDAAVLVLADPTSELSLQEQQKISAYITKGGNMLITADPGKQQILNPLLKQLGLQIKNGAVIVPDNNATPGFVKGKLTPEGAVLDPNLTNISTYHLTVALPGASVVERTTFSGFKVTPLLMSMPGGWNKIKKINPDASTDTSRAAKNISSSAPTVSTGSGNLSISGKTAVSDKVFYKRSKIDTNSSLIKFDPSTGDEKGVFQLASALSKNIAGKQQRIIVSGDANFTSNAELSRSPRGDQIDYIYGLFGWLSDGIYPVNVPDPKPKDMDLKISKEGITGLMWLCRAVIPAIIAITGAIVLLRRRRN